MRHTLGRRQTNCMQPAQGGNNHLVSLEDCYGGANVFNSLLPTLRRTALPQVLARTRAAIRPGAAVFIPLKFLNAAQTNHSP